MKGFLKTFLPIAGSIIGTMATGRSNMVGTALGSAVGAAAGRVLGGGNRKQILRDALLAGVGGAALKGVLGEKLNNNPISSVASSVRNIGSALIPSNSGTSELPDFVTQTLPVLVSGIIANRATAKAHKIAADAERENRENFLKNEEKNRQDFIDWHRPRPVKPTIGYFERHQHREGDVVGTPIKGKGDGQEDLIKNDRTRVGDWIWDAETVSNGFGNGSTEAGWKRIKELETFIKKLPHYKGMPYQRTPIVKTALSQGEYKTPAKIVMAAGGGSLEKGAATFRHMTQSMRKFKRDAHHHEIPDPIHNHLDIFKKSCASV